MKNQELFDRTVETLVKAYQNDTLVYTQCQACAVGNIVAQSNDIKIKKVADKILLSGPYIRWDANIALGMGKLYKGYNINNAFNTGYTLEELAKIEHAFYLGTCILGKEKESYRATEKEHFIGLMSVVDCLMEIHSADKIEITAAKSLFVKELAV